MFEMTAMKRDLLYVVRGLGNPTGIDVIREIEAYYNTIAHSHVYDLLAELVSAHYLRSRRYARRVEYRITPAGDRQIVAYHRWRDECIGRSTPP